MSLVPRKMSTWRNIALADERVQRRLTAIVAADVVGFSRLVEADEEGTLKKLSSLRDDLFLPRVNSDGGRIFKLTGDGLLLEYPSAVDAVRSAVELQEDIKRQNSIVPMNMRLVFRFGVNLGDVVVDGDDIYGDGVNIAARLEGICEPGEVFVSGSVFDQVAGKIPIIFHDLGEQMVKNISKPIRVYRAEHDLRGLSDASDGELELTVPDKPSIAVLPFVNMSSDPEQEYLADGISEDIITALSRISWFFVIARNTTFTYKAQAIEVQKIAKELGVRYVLEGSVRKAGNRIRITGQLIDGDTGNHIWAERYDRDLEDVFAVQDEITENIVGALEPQIAVAENLRSKQKAPQTLDAWDLVIRAMTLIGDFSKQSSKEALALLDRAIESDPTYARAYSQKSWTLAWRALQGWESMDSALPAAIYASDMAIKYDRDEPWAYIGLVFISVITRDGDKLLSSALRAVELNPNFALAHSFVGLSYALTGHGGDAFSWIEKARRLSPRDIFREEFDLHTSFVHFQVGNYEEAAIFAAKASMPRPEHVYPHLIAAASFALLDKLEHANDEISKVLRIVPDFSMGLIEKACVFLIADDMTRFFDALRKAGLPG